MYMYGNEGYMQVLFSATDFADFIAKADMMKSIVQADKDCATALEKTRAEVEEKKETIETGRAGKGRSGNCPAKPAKCQGSEG